MKMRRILILMVMGWVVLTAAILPAGMVSGATQADLDRIKQEKQEVAAQIKQYELEAKKLAVAAGTLANKISALRNEENKILAEIKLTQVRHDELVIKIETLQKRIDDNLEVIGYIVAQYYYNDDVSVLERLASSENLASFIDEEMQLSNMTEKMSLIVEENKVLKAEAEADRKEIEKLIKDMEAQKRAVELKRAEQQQLLNDTRGQESVFLGMKKEAQEKRKQLEAQERAIQAELCRVYGCSGITPGDPNKGGYPYSSECPQAKWNGRQRIDRWGMYTCECVSYAMWRIEDTYGKYPRWGGIGNAYEWDENAVNWGIRRDKKPAVGSVGMHNNGDWGHVVWVEAVAGDRIYVSQYNSANSATNYRSGEYSEMWVHKDSYDWFLHFEDW